MSTLPLDTSGYPVPTLGYLDGGARTLTLSATSNRTSTSFTTTTNVISIYSTIDCFIRLGSNTVTAANTDHFIPANMYQDIAITPATKDRHIAAIRAGAIDGTMYISERE
jgi:hypothetical protein